MLVLIIVIIVIATLIISSQNKTIANQELSISKLKQEIAGYEGQLRQLNIKAANFDRMEEQLKTGFLESNECKEYKTELRQLNQQVEQLNEVFWRYKKENANLQDRCFKLQDEIDRLNMNARKDPQEKVAEDKMTGGWSQDNKDYSAIK